MELLELSEAESPDDGEPRPSYSRWRSEALSILNETNLPDIIWAFGKYGEQPYHRYFRMLPHGRIGGHNHPNETRWEFRDNHLVILNTEGIVTTRIDRLEISDTGKLRLIGPMVTDPTGSVTHCWEQIDEPYSVATDPSAFKLDSHGSGKPRRNLVIMGANEQSLHHEWPRNIPDTERNWDLCLSFYGKPENYPPPGPAEYTSLQPGVRKWIAIHRAMHENSPFWQYQRILVLDDDIRTDWLDINRFFEIVERFDMALAQPSLTSDSHITHPITKQQPDCLVRFTTFVEAMAPCFTADALRLCISTTQGGHYGFGIDHLWPRILGMPQNRIGIVDAVAMEHTRPLAVNYPLHEAMNEESDLFARYGMGGGIGTFETGRIWQSLRDPAHTQQPLRQFDNSHALASSSTPRTMVAFRTHLWDENIALMARRLAGSAIGLDFCVVADETHGPLPIPPEFKKFSHNENFSDLGLPSFPAGQVLWYNADYPLYRLRQAFPDAEYIVMSEFDVVANVNLAKMMETVHSEKIDLLVGEGQEASPHWFWRPTLTRFFEKPYACLLPFMVISVRAVDYLLDLRQSHARDAGTLASNNDWAFCEGFVASSLMNAPQFKVAALEDYAELPFFRSWPPVSTFSPLNGRNGVIIHPVLSGDPFIKKLINEITLNEAIYPGGCLFDENYHHDRPQIINALFWHYRAMGRVDELARLYEIAATNGVELPKMPPNIAFRKSATQSSISAWSVGKTVEEDAQRINSPRIQGFGNHTDFEVDPWWQCDLEASYLINKVVIFNRMDNIDRCKKFVVFFSEDQTYWVLVYAKTDEIKFGGSDGNPYVVDLTPNMRTRYVRIQIIGSGFLHLEQIEMFEQHELINSTKNAHSVTDLAL
jgi:hypothetical protein